MTHQAGTQYEVRPEEAPLSGGPTGEPIEGALGDDGTPLEFSGETDEDGEHTDVVYKDNYRVEIDYPDYQSRTIHFIHADGADLSLMLEPL